MNNRLGAYLEQEILAASPVQLIHLLYQAAITEIRDARRHLAAGRLAEKCAHLTKACDLVGELRGSLNHEDGGEIARNLESLYDYILTRLLEGNLRKLDQPLAECLSLLSTLDEAWKELAQDSPPAPYPAGSHPTLAPAAFASGDMLDGATHAWSL